MTAQTLNIAYRGLSDETADWVHLEQPSVPTNRLSATDLQIMLGMVSNGISARSYVLSGCPAMISDGMISVGLVVWVWPSSMGLDYTLAATMGELGERVVIAQEREFNLEIDFSSPIELPFRCTNITWEWTGIPCLDRYGNEVERPELQVLPTEIRTTGDFYTVIRVRGLAHGYAHPLTVEIGKTGGVSITNVETTAQAAWNIDGEVESASLELAMPLCAEQLLAACSDGESIVERVYGSITDPEEKTPVLYYNSCTGRVLTVRYE